ncbi:MAG: hypothetical protein QXL94_05035 [Candidatus Parvarchaeum sp.]
MGKTSNNIQNIEKVAELTATFLIPFTLAIILFIAGAVSHAAYSQNPWQEALQTNGYWITFVNNSVFLLLIVSVILTWFLLVLYYLFGRENLLLLKGSIFLSGISLLSAAFLAFFPQEFLLKPNILIYSNYMRFLNAVIIFGVFTVVVIAYWCFCICAFREIKKSKR